MFFFLLPAMIFLIRGIYSLFCKPSFERTIFIVKKLDRIMPLHKIAELDHKAINVHFGVCSLSLSFFAALMGIGFEFFPILAALAFIFGSIFYFKFSARMEFKILNGEMFLKRD